MKLASGEIEDTAGLTDDGKNRAAIELGRTGGTGKGGDDSRSKNATRLAEMADWQGVDRTARVCNEGVYARL